MVLAHLLAEATAARKAIEAKRAASSPPAAHHPRRPPHFSGGPGAPQGDLQYGGGNGLGFYQFFQDGAIYWRRDLGACWVHGAIYQKYRALGAEEGFLGYPITDETGATDGTGRFNHFEGGSIYWHPVVGAFEIHGAIRVKWRSLGSEQFGYPVTDETGASDGIGRFNHFRDLLHGQTSTEDSIFWSPETGAHAIHGAIRRRWAELGWDSSYLGYPVTDQGAWINPETHNAEFVSHFQRGAITLRADDQSVSATPENQGVTEFPERIILSSGHIGVSAVGGWVELVLSSAGTFNYRGHLHNSGSVQLDCTVASALKIPGTSQGLMASKEVKTGGTVSFVERSKDWDDSGFDPAIRDNWKTLREGSSLVTTIDAQLGAASFFLVIFLPLIAAATIISLASGGSPPDTHCETSGMHTVKDGNNNTVAEPGGVRCGLPGPPR
jgi:hypothetical protein